MNAEIITVGTELLLGDILNTNSRFLSQELAALGISLHHQVTVGDNADRLGRAMTDAMERSDIVLITGGLGPTGDDISRETLCRVLHLPQELHEPSWQRIEEFFASTGKAPGENNKKQAMLPKGCTVFPNDHGTAPGCAVERYEQVFILLPGPPKELIPMFRQYVVPYLLKFSDSAIVSETVGLFGIRESAVDEQLADLCAGSNPTVAPYCHDGEVVLRVTAKAASKEQAKALCKPVIDTICSRLGEYVYGIDCPSLPVAVVEQLKHNRIRLATAESCTAGMLSQTVTQVPGASAVFGCGIAAYSAETKRDVLGVSQDLLDEQGTVAADVAAAMALGVRKLSDADIGVSITGEAGPNPAEKPVGTVFIGLADRRKVWTRELHLGEGRDRESIRNLATLHTLDLVRRYLAALPDELPGGYLPEVPEEAVEPPKAPKKKWWIVPLCILLAAAILIGAFFAGWHLRRSGTDDAAIFEELSKLYHGDVPAASSVYPADIRPEFYGLYDLNPDVGGWVRIEGTVVDHPVMQSADETFYRDHNFNRRASENGVPYFDADTALDGSGRTLVIYGNAAENGPFAPLLDYRDATFLDKHQTVACDTLYGSRRYGVVAVLMLKSNAGLDYSRSFFFNDNDYEKFLSAVMKTALYRTEATPDIGAKLLLLSVDASSVYTDGSTLVVVARELGDGEMAAADFVYNPHTGYTTDGCLLPTVQRNVQPVTDLPTSEPDTQEETVDTEDIWIPPEETEWIEPDDPLEPVETTTAKPTSTTTVTTNVTTSTTTKPTTTKKPTTATTTTVPTTVTTVITTTTTAPTSSTTTVTATTEPTSATTKTTVTTPTTTSPDLPTASNYVMPGTISESKFLANFRLKNENTGEVLTPKTKEELQLALAQIVKYEMGYSKIAQTSTAAWEAQAIAAYSYILYYCKGGGTYSVPLKKIDIVNDANDKRIYEAVGKVVGYKVLDTSKSDIKAMFCDTMYFDNSCGVTASCQYVYTQALPYLQSVPSIYDTDEYIYKYSGNKTLHTSTLTITLDEFIGSANKWLDAKVSTDAVLGYDTKEGGMPLYITSWDGGVGGYAINTNFYYTLKGKKTYITGKNMRVIINNYSAYNLRSHSFEVTEYNSSTGKMTIKVYGYGHGLGFSQMGAAGYANEAGWTAAQIINHYYSLKESGVYHLVAPVWD